MNSFKRVLAFQSELEFGSVGFWGEGKTGVPGEKPLVAKEKTNGKLSPHNYGVDAGPGPRWQKRSHHCSPQKLGWTTNQGLWKTCKIIVVVI